MCTTYQLDRDLFANCQTTGDANEGSGRAITVNSLSSLSMWGLRTGRLCGLGPGECQHRNEYTCLTGSPTMPLTASV